MAGNFHRSDHRPLDEPQRIPINRRINDTSVYNRAGPLYATQMASPDPFGLPYSHPEDPVYNEPDGTMQPDSSEAIDDFDRALLAEPTHDRQWQAARGLARLSLPHRSSYPLLPSQSFRENFVSDSNSRNHQMDHVACRTSPSGLTSDSSSEARLRTQACNPSRVQAIQKCKNSNLLSPLSPLTVPIPSSPSYAVSQRRSSHVPRKSELMTRQGPSKPLKYSFGVAGQPISSLVSTDRMIHYTSPVIQGIQLISRDALPDRFRSVFPFALLNAIQSKCFDTIYRSNENLVVSAPTGSGKTVLLELAICQLIANHQSGQCKVIYIAPTKSLCSERQADWQKKFNHLDFQCAELTGDTDQSQLKNVQNASIVITTPEKWDSVTRKWKDHMRLMQLVKLFLIDEVHILKESRGATLEAVISRMKSLESSVRFVALSATVPNSEDVALWLGRSHTLQHLPAHREVFGEEFRPVRLQRYVYGLPFKGNDFAFDSSCDSKLPEIIDKHSEKKPTMIFCCTRKSTVSTAKLLATTWNKTAARDRNWAAPRNTPLVWDHDLRTTLASGVAFHHAGLELQDRQAVESGFLNGDINVICCTSTLAVGVNLPCHLVIIKNTVAWQDERLKEYADLELMQMLGRAGRYVSAGATAVTSTAHQARPQFDKTATAVIITKQEKVDKYKKLVSGQELLESCLHLNLIDHLNAEIGLGTVHDLDTAKRWLSGTFLYVRLGKNPSHYKLDEDDIARNLDDRIRKICERDIDLLRDSRLISSADTLKATEFGHAMARYYVTYKTMTVLLKLPPHAKLSEILSALVQAEEFHEVRFRSGEKSLYKALNAANGIKFPIQIDIALSTQKRSIILQAELGGVEYPGDEQFVKHKRQYQQDKAILFSHIHRLIRCVIDCQIHLKDGQAVRHALELARSFAARVWDNSPLQMKQIASIGPISVRKLVTADINSLEVLENTEACKINVVLSKQPGFGEKILAVLKSFPKLRVSLKYVGIITMRPGQLPRMKVKAEVGFMNEKIPIFYNRKPVYICFIAERSDGHLVDFRRMSAKRLGDGVDILLSAELLHEKQYISCYVMCDEIAGTLRYAELKPKLSASLFPQALASNITKPDDLQPGNILASMNISRRRSLSSKTSVRKSFSSLDPRDQQKRPSDEEDLIFDAINDEDLLAAADEVERFQDVDSFGYPKSPRPSHLTMADLEAGWQPQRLENGNWACNHKCKDKTACKHLCCRDGLEKAPKAPKSVTAPKESSILSAPRSVAAQLTATPSHPQNLKDFARGRIEMVDLSSGGPYQYKRHNDGTLQALDWLPSKTTKKLPLASMPLQQLKLAKNSQAQPPEISKATHAQSRLSFPGQVDNSTGSFNDPSTEFETDWSEDLPSPSLLTRQDNGQRESRNRDGNCQQFEILAEPVLSPGNAGGLDSHVVPASPICTEPLIDPSTAFADTDVLPDSRSGTATIPSMKLPENENGACFVNTQSLTDGADIDCTNNFERSSKRQKTSPPEASFVHNGNDMENQKADLRKLFPWDDMTGIDMEFLAEFADICEFI